MRQALIYLLFITFVHQVVFAADANSSSVATTSTSTVITSNAVPRCNVNKECPFAFVCIAGDADLTDNTGYTGADSAQAGKYIYKGFCTPTVPLRQACYLHKIITGIVGKGITALALIMLCLGFIQGKIDIRQIATFFAAVVLLFGSFEVVYFLINEKHRYCEIINYEAPLGYPPDYEGFSSDIIGS